MTHDCSLAGFAASTLGLTEKEKEYMVNLQGE
jgi:hypothetical protein